MNKSLNNLMYEMKGINESINEIEKRIAEEKAIKDGLINARFKEICKELNDICNVLREFKDKLPLKNTGFGVPVSESYELIFFVNEPNYNNVRLVKNHSYLTDIYVGTRENPSYSMPLTDYTKLKLHNYVGLSSANAMAEKYLDNVLSSDIITTVFIDTVLYNFETELRNHMNNVLNDKLDIIEK